MEKVKELEEKVRAHQKNSKSRAKINNHLKSELDKEKRRSKELTKLLRKHQKGTQFNKEKCNNSCGLISYRQNQKWFEISIWIDFFERKNEPGGGFERRLGFLQNV